MVWPREQEQGKHESHHLFCLAYLAKLLLPLFELSLRKEAG